MKGSKMKSLNIFEENLGLTIACMLGRSTLRQLVLMTSFTGSPWAITFLRSRLLSRKTSLLQCFANFVNTARPRSASTLHPSRLGLEELRLRNFHTLIQRASLSTSSTSIKWAQIYKLAYG